MQKFPDRLLDNFKTFAGREKNYKNTQYPDYTCEVQRNDKNDVIIF